METITTLDRLIYHLNMGPGYEGYVEMVKAIEFDPAELTEIKHWGEDHHRVRFYDTACLEALFTFWSQGQKSVVHNYNFNHGWLKVVEGELQLEYFKINVGKRDLRTTLKLSKGDVAMLNDDLGFHRFSNIGKGKAVMLHLYSDKIEDWEVFDEVTGALRTERVVCDKEIQS